MIFFSCKFKSQILKLTWLSPATQSSPYEKPPLHAMPLRHHAKCFATPWLRLPDIFFLLKNSARYFFFKLETYARYFFRICTAPHLKSNGPPVINIRYGASVKICSVAYYSGFSSNVASKTAQTKQQLTYTRNDCLPDELSNMDEFFQHDVVYRCCQRMVNCAYVRNIRN